MSGRSPAEAVQQFIDPLSRVVSCITRSVLDVAGGYYVSDYPHAVMLANADPVILAGDSRLSFRMIHYYWVFEASDQPRLFQVASAGYFYGFSDDEGHDMLIFHWHPGGRSPVPYPHIHLGAGAMVGRPEIAGAHIPTGQIDFAQVVRLAIEELGVDPRRRDWREVLADAGLRVEDR